MNVSCLALGLIARSRQVVRFYRSCIMSSWRYRIGLLSLITTSFSCQESDKAPTFTQVETTEKLVGLTLKLDSLTVETQGMLPFYEVSGVVHNRREVIFVGYDGTRHALNVIDVSSRKVLKAIPLEKEGPMGVDQISGLYCQSLDSLFAVGMNSSLIYLLDAEGRIRRKWPINALDRKHAAFYDDNVFSPMTQSGFYFDQNSKSIYIKNNYYRKSQSTQTQEYYNEALLLGKVDLATAKPELLDIPYSPTLREHYVGDLDNPDFVFMTKNGSLDKVVYSFPATADILSYELATGRTTLYAPSSRPINQHIKYLNWNDAKSFAAKSQSYRNESRYGKIISIADRDKLYYVQFCQGVPVNTTENYFTYKVFLLVYDENFNVIYQSKAMPFTFYNHAFYRDKKIYMFQPQGRSEDELSFLTIALEGLDNQ